MRGRPANYERPSEPWSIHESDTRLIIKSGSRTIAYVQLGPHDMENAAYIVAAQEGVALARRFLECFGGSDSELHVMARGVIAKVNAALGEEG